MYYYVKGILARKGDGFIVVEAGGVGYMIYTSLNSITLAPAVGSEITMYTYLYVREDVMDLYGFTLQEEKDMFMKLISVSGVGPKAALAILSVSTPAKLAAAVVTNDAKTITKASGVGPKMAQRVILELKDKIDAASLNIDADDLGEGAPSDNKNEAISALMALGYSLADAQNAVRKTDGTLSVEEIIKKALTSLL